MRADRLVATLLFLQARGRVTAEEVAKELEVSTRTARRDLEALSIAGIPVYSQAGRGGGWSLIGGARTDLSGLTAAEARTLFLVAGPSSAITPEAKAALRKLVHALPATFRAEAEAAANAVVLDPARWGEEAPTPPPFLEVLQQAVIAGVQVRLGYSDRTRTVTERIVHPLGLVAKGSTWYLIAGTEAGMRTFRLWRIRAVELTDDAVHRPADFDLATAWQSVVERMDRHRHVVEVEALVGRWLVGPLRGHFGVRLRVDADDATEPRAAGGGDAAEGADRVRVRIGFPDVRQAGRELAGYDALEVTGPPEVRDELAAAGRRLIGRYAG
jgi:predicted DNA-binding transcriptional regulator YafY